MAKPRRRYHVQVCLSTFDIMSTDDEWAVSEAQAKNQYRYRIWKTEGKFIDLSKFEAWEVV